MQHFMSLRTSKLYASRNEVIVMRKTSLGESCSASARAKNSDPKFDKRLSISPPDPKTLFGSPGVADSGLRIGDWGLQRSEMPNPKSAIPNSQLPPQQPRRPRYRSMSCRARGRVKVIPLAKISK